ncbi:MAG TPA: TetR family transcriptional regulator [Solirubrobacterales bacterium]|nr:TetR family transcriptional regulator [Solirubrobacterales bacterium]
MNTRAPESRAERKRQTRQALLDAALRLLEEQSFSGLGLRAVTREAGVVPTTFYRHFERMEDLGLALIDESFRTLREMIRDARSDPANYEHVIASSVEILVRHVQQNRLHFGFIARERFSGVAEIRHAIRAEIRLFGSELATDLARFPYMREWGTEDLQVMAGLIVNAMVSIAEEVLDAPAGGPEAVQEIRRIAEKQLRMIVIGAPAWQSSRR